MLFRSYEQIGRFRVVKLTTPPNCRILKMLNVYSLTIRGLDGVRKTVNSGYTMNAGDRGAYPPDYVALELLKRLWPNIQFELTYEH